MEHPFRRIRTHSYNPYFTERSATDQAIELKQVEEFVLNNMNEADELKPDIRTMLDKRMKKQPTEVFSEFERLFMSEGKTDSLLEI